MLKITYKWREKDRGDWQTQTCEMSSTAECIDYYNLLDPNIEFEFIGIEELPEA